MSSSSSQTLEVLSYGDASCGVRSDCTVIQTAAECFEEAQAQGIGTHGYVHAFERAASQPGCFLYECNNVTGCSSGYNELVEFNADLDAKGAWGDIAPICWCTGQEPTPLVESILLGVGGLGPGPFIVAFFFILWNSGVGVFFAKPMAEFVSTRDRRSLWKAMMSCFIPHVAVGVAIPAIMGGLVGFLVGVFVPYAYVFKKLCRGQHVSQPGIGNAAPTSRTQRIRRVTGAQAAADAIESLSERSCGSGSGSPSSGGKAVTIDLPRLGSRSQQDHEKHTWHRLQLPQSWAACGSGSLSVSWKDQGWGNQKGHLWGRVVPPLAPPGTPPEGAWLRISTHNAPHQWKTETFQLPAAWFAEGAPGAQATNLVLAYEVGGGGGHELHLRDGAKLKLEPRRAAVAAAAAAHGVFVDVEADGAPAPERQLTGDSDSSPPAYQTHTVVAGVPVAGVPVSGAPMVTVAGAVVSVDDVPAGSAPVLVVGAVPGAV